MNLPVIFSKVLAGMKGFGGKALIFGKRHAPEICIGIGVAGFVGTVAGTVHATNQTRDILDAKNDQIEQFDKLASDPTVAYNDEDYNNDVKKLKKRTRRRLFKTWWPVGTLGLGSIFSFLSGYKIVSGRYAATAAAYKTLEAGYERYRENVIAKFGKDVDNEMMQIKAEEIEKQLQKEAEEEKAADASGKKLKKRKLQPGNDIQIFNYKSDRWRDYWTPDMALDYLRTIQNQCNDELKMTGSFFVNEANEYLGFKRTCEGQVLGWIWDPKNGFEDEIDFGLDNLSPEQMRIILSTTRNCDIQIPIRMNPRGIVFDLLGHK